MKASIISTVAGVVELLLAAVGTAHAQAQPSVTIPFPSAVGVVPNASAPATPGATTTVTVNIPAGGVAPVLQPFQVQPVVTVEVNLGTVGQDVEVTCICP